MPGGDRTGPMGAGPMTGRGAGLCAGVPAPGFMNRGFGGGFGRGGGRGRRNQYFATGLTGRQRAGMGQPAFADGASAPAEPAQNTNQELDTLQQQATLLGEQLEAIKQRIDQLSSR